jgi:hypothetical protein
MRQRIHHRLKQLEVVSALSRRQAEMQQEQARMERTINRIRLFLRVCRVEQEGHESLMEAWARALGIALRDLRAMLAAGIDPIRKYFVDHGVCDETGKLTS